MQTVRAYSQKQVSPSFTRKDSQSSQAGGTTAVPKICNISLLPNDDDSPGRNQAEQTTLWVYRSYALPSVAALVRYCYAAAG